MGEGDQVEPSQYVYWVVSVAEAGSTRATLRPVPSEVAPKRRSLPFQGEMQDVKELYCVSEGWGRGGELVVVVVVVAVSGGEGEGGEVATWNRTGTALSAPGPELVGVYRTIVLYSGEPAPVLSMMTTL